MSRTDAHVPFHTTLNRVPAVSRAERHDALCENAYPHERGDWSAGVGSKTREEAALRVARRRSTNKWVAFRLAYTNGIKHDSELMPALIEEWIKADCARMLNSSYFVIPGTRTCDIDTPGANYRSRHCSYTIDGGIGWHEAEATFGRYGWDRHEDFNKDVSGARNRYVDRHGMPRGGGVMTPDQWEDMWLDAENL